MKCPSRCASRAAISAGAGAAIVGDSAMAHAAIPDSGTDALQGATHILHALYKLNADYLKVTSKVEGISHPYLNVGQIHGGTNTNVVPGKVVFKLVLKSSNCLSMLVIHAFYSFHKLLLCELCQIIFELLQFFNLFC